MAQENVGKFEMLLRQDEELQAKLKAATEAWEGDADDKAAFFDATVGALAADGGLPFTLEEARTYVPDGVDLDDSELDAVAGGGPCLYVGAKGNCYFTGSHGDCFTSLGSGITGGAM